MERAGEASNYFYADSPDFEAPNAASCSDQFNQQQQDINPGDVIETLDGWLNYYEFHDGEERKIVPKHQPF